jgi:hypothetical protein
VGSIPAEGTTRNHAERRVFSIVRERKQTALLSCMNRIGVARASRAKRVLLRPNTKWFLPRAQKKKHPKVLLEKRRTKLHSDTLLLS